ncbi:MAG: DsbA family protein [Propionibacteriaceae bacterium]|nr:DsbA family protein [Propionibacteriaceae bacterium]
MAKNKPQSGKDAKPQMTSAQRRAKLEAAKRSQERWQRTKRILIGVVVVVVIIIVVAVIAAVANNKRQSDNANATSGATAAQITPPNATTISNGTQAIIADPAAKDAPLTLDIHADYQCPNCKHAEMSLGQGLSQLESQNQVLVRYHLRTFLDGNLGNTSSSQAAMAATCADTVGKFQAMNDVIFANQPTNEGTGYTTDQLRNTFATQAGISGDDLTKYQTCFDDKATSNFVSTMEQSNLTTPVPGIDDYSTGVRGTPAFIINGKQLNWTEIPTDATSMLTYLEKIANS